MNIKRLFSSDIGILLATLLGIFSGYGRIDMLIYIAQGMSAVFINLLKLISLPIVFLSMVSTISGMESLAEMQLLGKKVLFYTVSTTIVAALVALGLFNLINPVGVPAGIVHGPPPGMCNNYWHFLLQIIPDNIMLTLSNNNNVMGVVFIAVIFSFSILALPDENKQLLHDFFSSLFGAVLNIARGIVYIMPFGVWAFVSLFVYSFNDGFGDIKSIALYVICIIAANIVQGFIVLPLLLKIKGISPIKMIKGMARALTIAFFSKSSSATLPVTINAVQKNLRVKKRVASFALPLCSVINMNGCAAFILITVLYVASHYGMVFTPFDMLVWVAISSIAAIGNAGVPMGCYFLASALLTSMNVSLAMMGIILPIYTLIDMVETALNVWSDSVIAVIVDRELMPRTK